MNIWYIIIGLLLLGFFIGFGYVYTKILKNKIRKFGKNMERPFKEDESISK